MSNVIQLARRFHYGRLAALALVAAAAACSNDKKSAGSSAAAKAALPASFALASEPSGAKAVKEVVAAAKNGDELVVAGRVAQEGNDAAFFTLVDTSVKPCTEMEVPDACPTPWDYCCEPSEEMAKSSATVVFRDGAKPYAGNVLGFHGLDHLTQVVVKGKAERDSGGNLTIVADGIFVKK